MAKTSNARTLWLPLILVMILEFLFFDQMTSQHYAWVYPRWHDQIQPLTESYTGYEYLKAHGFWPGIRHTLAKPAAQGELHSLWAILVFSATGHPSRSAALAVNMLAFLAWQAALAYAVVKGSRSSSLAWVAVGLTLALRWPWTGAQGSAIDFRLDHVTMCMMGISLAAALLTNGFRSTFWSIALGVSTGLTLLTRFLTGTYFVVIFGACLLWILVSGDRRRRSVNIALAAATAVLLAGPFFWLNFREIYSHYWIGHYFTPDGVLWSSNLSFFSASSRLWRQLCVEQLGSMFWIAAGIAVLVPVGGVLWASRRLPSETAPEKSHWPKEAALLGAVFLLAPALVLSIQNQDLMVLVVLGVAVPGALILLMALCAQLRDWAACRVSAAVTPRLSVAMAVATFSLGGWSYATRQTAPSYGADFAADARLVNALADRLFAAASARGIAEPQVGVDQITDCFDGQILRIICYERHQVWVPFATTLPLGTLEASESLLMERLASSDFVFVTEDGPSGRWPYDRQMYALRPKILAWCDAHLDLTERFTLFGQRMTLYQRRDI